MRIGAKNDFTKRGRVYVYIAVCIKEVALKRTFYGVRQNLNDVLLKTKNKL